MGRTVEVPEPVPIAAEFIGGKADLPELKDVIFKFVMFVAIDSFCFCMLVKLKEPSFWLVFESARPNSFGVS